MPAGCHAGRGPAKHDKSRWRLAQLRRGFMLRRGGWGPHIGCGSHFGSKILMENHTLNPQPSTPVTRAFFGAQALSSVGPA